MTSEDLPTDPAGSTPAIAETTTSNGVVASKSAQTLRSTATARSRSGSSASAVNTPNGSVVGISMTSGTGLSVETVQRSGRGRSSRAAAAALLASDARYKRYAQAIDRCLSTFDTVAEWADFIAFLSRLLKTIQSAQPPFSEIPYKLIIAKRLAQGLNPALPNGVHQKSLEVYREILRSIGIDGLKRDLQVWSPGLFPFFQFAATGLKPLLLDLYESFYIPLGRDLRPVAKSMALALLPGIEEETGDYFDRTLDLLTKLADSVDTGFFYQCLFLVMVTNASSRLAAVNYLSRRLRPSLSELTTEAGATGLAEIIGSDTGLLVRGLAAGLDDDTVLVRRGVLDLLIAILPLNKMSTSNVNEADQRRLMLAACSIVLRRDLSLNKRLYIWLLGPSDEAEKQTDYFHSHALSTLTEALAGDMTEATLPAQTRDMNTPFKVYIALLDKWEIGYPLSEALALRALETLRGGIETLNRSSDATIRAQGSDLQVTAHTLYEASEPSIIWSNFYRFVCHDFEPDTQGKEDALHMDLVIWVLNSFRIHDDEVLLVHAPLLLGRVMQFVQDRAMPDGISASGDSRLIEVALELASLLANIVPKAAFNDHSKEGKSDLDAKGLCAADEIYQSAEQNLDHFYLGGHNYFSLLFRCVIESFRPLRTAKDATVLRLASICQRLVEIQHENGVDQHLSWESAEWIKLVAELAQQSTSFEVVQALVSTLVALRDCSNITPSVAIDSSATLRPLIVSAFDMLESQTLDVQPAIVALIWKLHDLRPGHIVETIVCERLGAGDRASQTRSMNAFGTLWRLTDESHNPGTVLYRPALMILGFLRHDQLVLKRAAETWMRCYLRSAFRILDPLLFDLLDDDLRTKPYTMELAEHHITVPRYICRVDFDRCRALLEVTLNLIEIGGQAMQRACIGTAVRETMDKQLLSRVTADADLHQGSSYTDMIVGLCTRLVSSQPSVIDTPTSKEANAGVQSAALQILQVLVGRGDIPVARLRKVESSVVDQLFVCIHTTALDIQNQLLHLLHSVILAIAAGEAAQREPMSPSTLEGPRVGDDRASRKSRTSISELNNPLLLRILQDGIVVKSNRCLLQFWVDFILMTVPHLVGNLQSLCFPLCDTICKEIDSAATSWQNNLQGSAAVTEAEVVMLLSCLERVVLTAMSWSHLNSERNANQKGSAETAGLFGYVSNVFQADVPMSSHSPLRVPGMRCLRTAVATLVLVWQTGSRSTNGPLARCTSRCRKMFERLYQTHEEEVLSAIVECTVSDDGAILYPSAWELLELLVSGTQQIVKHLCDSLAATLIAPPKTGDSVATIHQGKLLHFLLGYFETLEGPIVVQSWSSCVNLAKTTYTNVSNVAPNMLLLFLRFFTKFGVLVSTTAALSDKRMRKDWQDSYSKLLDSVLVTAGRAAFVPSRPSTPKVPSVPSVNAPTEKGLLRRTSKESLKSTGAVEDVLDRLCLLLAKEVVPHLRDLLIDTERVQTACAAIAQNVLQPAFKARARFGDVDVLALDILLAMSQLTTVQKHWRTYVSEAFADGTVFQASQATRSQWKQLVAVMMDQERDRLLDLLNRVAAPPSANIFANRELEMQQRCLNLRRLSLVIFAASHNHFIVQLPAIQERLVDLLRTSNVSSAVHSEVYLCLRVLLCRFSSQHLVNLWPIILSELIKTFEQTMDNIPEQETETLHLLLSACKLLDLMMVMQTEDFQIHQWLFVTDTPDAQDPPDGWIAEAIMDRLAELVSDHYHADSSAPILRYPVSHQGFRPRRPMLMQVKDIGSLLELEPFFSQASISAYAGMYNGNSVDWEYVESAMEREIFERS